MPRISSFRRRKYRIKSSKYEKIRRRWKFTEKQKWDSKTGLNRSKNDVGRSGKFGPLIYEYESPANGLTLRSRCPFDCPICKGREPGCQGSPERTEKNLRIYQASVAHVEQQFRLENDDYKRHLVFFRTLAYLHYLREFAFSLRNPTPVFFSLYEQRLAVVRYPWYPQKRVAFQNILDSTPFLTWKREKRCVVLSPNQIKSSMYLGGITTFLSIHLVPSTQRSKVYLRSHILRRLF